MRVTQDSTFEVNNSYQTITTAYVPRNDQSGNQLVLGLQEQQKSFLLSAENKTTYTQ